MWKKITSIFDFSLGRDPGAKGLPLNVEAAWQAYIGQERLWPRFCRAAIYTLGMLFLGIFVLVPMFGMPTNPARSELAYYAYKYTTLTDVLLMQFLAFLVFDATCFCLLFVNKLHRAQTQWPQKTTEVYNKRLQLQTKLVHDWIDLDFVAKRTRCIGCADLFSLCADRLADCLPQHNVRQLRPEYRHTHFTRNQSDCRFCLRLYVVAGGESSAGHGQAKSRRMRSFAQKLRTATAVSRSS